MRQINFVSSRLVQTALLKRKIKSKIGALDQIVLWKSLLNHRKISLAAMMTSCRASSASKRDLTAQSMKIKTRNKLKKLKKSAPIK